MAHQSLVHPAGFFNLRLMGNHISHGNWATPYAGSHIADICKLKPIVAGVLSHDERVSDFVFADVADTLEEIHNFTAEMCRRAPCLRVKAVHSQQSSEELEQTAWRYGRPSDC